MKLAYPLLVLLFLSVFMLPTVNAEISIQTRYATTLGCMYNSYMSAWLGTCFDTILGYDYFLKLNTALASTWARWGIRVFIVHWDYGNTTVLDEITSGSFVAQVTRSTNGEGLQSATWDCPETTLSRNDTILVRYYYRFGVGLTVPACYLASAIYILVSEFVMENNGFVKLLASTWNVTYYTYRNYPVSSKTEGRLYFGNSTYNTHIENMQFDDGVSEEPESEFPVGLGAGAILMGFVAVIAFSIKKRR